MTPAGLNSLINFYCGGITDAEFPPEEKLVLINAFKDDFSAEIAKRNEDLFGIVLTDNLNAGQRSYPHPDDVLNGIKGLEAKLDGTTWKWIREFDINTMKRPTDEDDILANFMGLEPAYDIFDRSFYIYSDSAIIDVTDGLKLWCIVYPADITDLTSETDMSLNPTRTSHGFPRQFHELLARRVSIAWKNKGDRPKTLSEKENLFEYDFNKKLEAISLGNLDRSIIATVPDDTGVNY